MTLRSGVVVMLLYLGLSIVMTWPLAAHMTDAVPFYNDTWIFVWNVEHVRSALLAGKSVYETSDVFHPHGVSLAYHTLAPLYGALALPLRGELGLIATYNVFILLTYLSSAMAAFALVRGLTHDTGAAFVAGALFTFSPFHQVHTPHLNLLSLQFLPLAAWAALRFVRTASWRHAMALAAAGALSFYACHEYAFFAAILAVLFLLHAAVRGELARWPDVVGRGVGSASVALGFAAPGIIPMIAEAAIETHYAEPVDVTFSADLFSWITPSVLHSLWGGYTMKVYQHFPGVLAEWTTYLGVTVSALCAVAIVTRQRRHTSIWLLVAVVFGILAMGPVLRVLGQPTALALPYAWLKSLPVLSAMREPSRFAAGVTLATSVLAAYGFQSLRRRFGRKTFLLLPLALLEFVQVRYPMSDATVPEFLHQLAADPRDYAILDVPAGLELREHLYHQAIHRKRIFLGYIARIPAAHRRYIETEALLRDPATWELSRPGEAERLARTAVNLDVRYALVHAAFYRSRGQPERFERAVIQLGKLPGARLVAREPGFAAIELGTR